MTNGVFDKGVIQGENIPRGKDVLGEEYLVCNTISFVSFQ